MIFFLKFDYYNILVVVTKNILILAKYFLKIDKICIVPETNSLLSIFSKKSSVYSE